MSTLASARLGHRHIRTLVVLGLAASLVVPATTSASDVARETDIALALDASDNLSAADWAILRRGLASMVFDTVQYPRDCSRGIVVVLYAASAEVAVPYTRICTEADAWMLAEAFTRLSQLGGRIADPAAGLTAATAAVLNDTPARPETIVLAPAGLRAAGDQRLQDASRSAKRLGIDNLAVSVIASPRIPIENYRTIYGSIIFNKGVFEVTRNITEWVHIIDYLPLLGAGTLVGIEVNQAVQDWNNSWTLVGRKATMVRAHVSSPDAGEASARLYGTRDGQPLAGSPLSALNKPVLPVDAVAVRKDPTRSINFTLPTSWAEGTITLEVKGLGLVLTCNDKSQIDDDCKATVTFRAPPKDLPIRYVRVARPDESESAPSLTEVNYHRATQRQIFPILGVQKHSSTYDWKGTGAPSGDLDVLLDKLEAIRATDSTCPDCYYYGVLDESAGTGGLGFSPGKVAAGNMPENNAFAHARNRHAHELLHNLSRPHSLYQGKGQCSEKNEAGVDFPYFAMINGKRVPVLGELGGTEEEKVYGLVPDLYYTAQDKSVVDPYTTFELMGYCGALVTGQGRWISGWNYAYAYGYLSTLLGTKSVVEDGDALFVRGRIDEGAGRATFLPFLRLEGTPPREQEPGRYTLRLLDAGGLTIRDISFEPVESHGDAPGREGVEKSFLVKVTDPGAVRAVQVLLGDVVLGERAASATPPEVHLRSPGEGETLSADTAISWDASDGDGDTLTFVAQYSADGGTTWKTLTVDNTDTSAVLEFESIRATPNALVRVVATDGFDSATDTSAPFTVVNGGPTITLITPADGAVFEGTNGIALTAEAVDDEDGTLEGESIAWSSDLDGPLGTGALVYREADSLSEGTHVITVTATDSEGASSSESLTIIVRRVGPGGDVTPPVVRATLSSAPSPSGWHATPVSVQLEATDDATGVADLRYRVDGGDETIVPVASATINVTTPGPHSVEYRASDVAGNVSESQTISLSIDPVGPSATMTTPDLSIVTPLAPIELTGAATDPALGPYAGSGVVDACFDVQRITVVITPESLGCMQAAPAGADGWRRTVPLGLGIYSVSLVATDGAGNVTTSSPIRIVVLA